LNINFLSLWLAAGFTIVSTVSGQTTPNFNGAWEFVAVERNGNRITPSTPGNTLGKETHILIYKEPTLKIKMLMESGTGLTTLELLYTIDGKAGPVGEIQRPDGTHDPVDGSAHWEGDRLIYEQGVHDSSKGTVFHIIRSLKLEKDGMSMMADEVVWREPGGAKSTSRRFWEKKPHAP
jgi:hypothetical protein